MSQPSTNVLLSTPYCHVARHPLTSYFSHPVCHVAAIHLRHTLHTPRLSCRRHLLTPHLITNQTLVDICDMTIMA